MGGLGVRGLSLRRGPVGTLIDPAAKQADLLGGETGAHGRHHLLFLAGDHADDAAGGAVAGLDHFERGVLVVQAEAAHLLLRAVADIAATRQERRDVARVINFGPSGGRKVVGGKGEGGKRQKDGIASPARSVHVSHYIPPGNEVSKSERRPMRPAARGEPRSEGRTARNAGPAAG